MRLPLCHLLPPNALAPSCSFRCHAPPVAADHLWQQALQHCPYCRDPRSLRLRLHAWWFAPMPGVDYRALVIAAFRQHASEGDRSLVWACNVEARWEDGNTGMLSYPNGNTGKVPRVDWLASAAVEAGVDLRVLVLTRGAADCLRSVHRRFSVAYAEPNAAFGGETQCAPDASACAVARALAFGASKLAAQLGALRQARPFGPYECVAYERAPEMAPRLDDLLRGEPSRAASFRFAEYVAEHFEPAANRRHDGTPDGAAASKMNHSRAQGLHAAAEPAGAAEEKSREWLAPLLPQFEEINWACSYL